MLIKPLFFPKCSTLQTTPPNLVLRTQPLGHSYEVNSSGKRAGIVALRPRPPTLTALRASVFALEAHHQRTSAYGRHVPSAQL